MQKWAPITDEEFNSLFNLQYAEFNDNERAAFNTYRVCPWKAIIRRSEVAGDEAVFVVAELPGGVVLYFDDVEYGFNLSLIDTAGRITNPGGSQCTLKDAVCNWLPKWNIPISDEDFYSLFDSQYQELDDDERIALNVFRVPAKKALVRRSEAARDEPVFVVAELPDRSALYFNDARYSFNVGPMDASGRIIDFSADHNSLKDAVHKWFPKWFRQHGQ